MDNLAVIDDCDTTPKLFRSRCDELGTVIALREKEFGIWHSFSWNDYYDKAKCIGIDLLCKSNDGCGVLVHLGLVKRSVRRQCYRSAHRVEQFDGELLWRRRLGLHCSWVGRGGSRR